VRKQGDCMVQVLSNVGTPFEQWKLYTEEPMELREARVLRDEVMDSIPDGSERVRVVRMVPTS
jgi:hypothetical protein